MRSSAKILLTSLLLIAAACAWCAPLPDKTWPVTYRIDARLDVDRRTIEASEILIYRNLTGQPLDRFPFHLYLNAFQPTSTFMSEVRREDPGFAWQDKWAGSVEIKSLSVVGVGDLTKQIRYLHPDDDNKNDRTVMEVPLPRPVPPGGEVEFRIVFKDTFPEVFARTGYKRDFFMGAQWFPKVGVWWKGSWNCHQFHANTEFFSDFGTYDVTLTLPQSYVIGASGTESSSRNNADGTKTVTFHGDAIHDFAWTASPRFQVVNDAFKGSAGPVRIRLLMQPGHMKQVQRHLDALKGTMRLFDQWYGPYPYPQITLVDPPHGAARAGGMEYPTMFTAGTQWWMPQGLRYPELVVAHEFGHQYWQGMVASNEFEDAWLDEGINSYSEAKAMNALYGPDTSIIRLAGVSLGESGFHRRQYLSQPDTDPLARPGWQFMNREAYGGITYSKAATMLLTLEKIVGEETLQRALRTYFMRYRFTHPTREDFLRTFEEVSGKNLRWYFAQAVYGTNVVDYEVLRISSDRPDWAKKRSERQDKSGDAHYKSTVLVHRKGDFIFPVDVLVKFDNGETAREHWDGTDRWVRYTYARKGRIVSAELDPTHQVGLDRDLYNNSRTQASNSGAGRKLANYWMFISQLFAQLLAWLV